MIKAAFSGLGIAQFAKANGQAVIAGSAAQRSGGRPGFARFGPSFDLAAGTWYNRNWQTIAQDQGLINRRWRV